MSTPHKHAAVIKAWADGAEIEFKATDGWTAMERPLWWDHHCYRVKVVPKWPAERAAYAAGKKIQCRQYCTREENPWPEADRGPWKDWDTSMPPSWDNTSWMEYRVKPERAELFLLACPRGVGVLKGVDLHKANIKLVFEGEKLDLASILY